MEPTEDHHCNGGETTASPSERYSIIACSIRLVIGMRSAEQERMMLPN